MGAPEPPISQRKADHLVVAASGKADFRSRSTLLEEVHLIHQALPETALDAIDLRTTLAGFSLSAPIVISGMTGGTAAAKEINRDLAQVAERMGIAFGVGSQRAMATHPDLEQTFQVRDVAPDVVLVGNIGVVQALALGTAATEELAKRIGANALAIHLNPAMELIQHDGDRDFRGAARFLGTLAESARMPIIVKETGCGLSAQTAKQLQSLGIRTVDVSGAGGTSWVGVEAKRALRGSNAEQLGHELWDWGVPTAVSVAACHQQGLEIIATGGIRSGLDIARAMALGATCGGLAAPILRAHQHSGQQGAQQFVEQLIHSVRVVTLLSGCSSAGEFASVPRHLGIQLTKWIDDLGLR